MISHLKGQTYHTQSLAIMMLSHPTAKKYDQPLPWAIKSGRKVAELYLDSHNGIHARIFPGKTTITI
ncbi:MAG: hypothetical protein ACJAQT_003343 [Akkermansiaceae bacterium]|jgi:hypothetical protein